MRAFSVSYNFGSDETKITFSKDFKEGDYILRLDILKDAIHDLQTTYDKTLLQKREINLATGENIKEGELMTDDEYQQMMDERQQILEAAFDRAHTGFATEEDWAVLRYECGLSAQMRKEDHVNSESRVQ